MTNGLCHDYCQPKGFAFAITQFQDCWCSDIAPATTDSTGTGSCDIPCPGFPSELCGNKAQGLYGYVALGKKPTSTAGGPASGSSSSEIEPSGIPFGMGKFGIPIAPSTVVQTSVVVSTQKVYQAIVVARRLEADSLHRRPLTHHRPPRVKNPALWYKRQSSLPVL